MYAWRVHMLFDNWFFTNTHRNITGIFILLGFTFITTINCSFFLSFLLAQTNFCYITINPVLKWHKLELTTTYITSEISSFIFGIHSPVFWIIYFDILLDIWQYYMSGTKQLFQCTIPLFIFDSSMWHLVMVFFFFA